MNMSPWLGHARRERQELRSLCSLACGAVLVMVALSACSPTGSTAPATTSTVAYPAASTSSDGCSSLNARAVGLALQSDGVFIPLGYIADATNQLDPAPVKAGVKTEAGGAAHGGIGYVDIYCTTAQREADHPAWPPPPKAYVVSCGPILVAFQADSVAVSDPAATAAADAARTQALLGTHYGPCPSAPQATPTSAAAPASAAPPGCFPLNAEDVASGLIAAGVFPSNLGGAVNYGPAITQKERDAGVQSLASLTGNGSEVFVFVYCTATQQRADPSPMGTPSQYEVGCGPIHVDEGLDPNMSLNDPAAAAADMSKARPILATRYGPC